MVGSLALLLAVGLAPSCSDEETAPSCDGGASGTGGDGGACPSYPCKLTLPQCGCRQGWQCTVDIWTGEVECVPELGDPAQPGEPCGGSLVGCVAGSLCLRHAVDGPWSCHAFCEQQDDCPLPGSHCLPVEGVTGTSSGGAQICTPSCNPLDGSGCVAGARCTVAQEPDPPYQWFTTCIAEGAQPHGASCSDIYECALGLCVDLGASGQQCLDLCDVDQPTCPPGSSCTEFSEPIVIDATNYGVCWSP